MTPPSCPLASTSVLWHAKLMCIQYVCVYVYMYMYVYFRYMHLKQNKNKQKHLVSSWFKTLLLKLKANALPSENIKCI